MEGQPFFTSVAGLAISLAGFGAVIAWLREDPTGWDPVNLWRLKTIVRHALTIAFLSLALVPIFTFSQSAGTTIRIGSGLAAAFVFGDVLRFRRPDPAVWQPRSSWQVFMGFTALLSALALANLLWASLGLLQALILVLLTSPAGIFSNFVREVGGSSRPSDEPAADS